ncbi:MAG: hypothetical protein LBB65_09045 [Burkholderiales bacterium]|jgi:hypothetical protein|nr:hypothetical protein [Burkholderiales bacterium]
MSVSLKVLTEADIKLFLETAPLYSWYEFKRPLVNRSSLCIGQIDTYCDACNKQRTFLCQCTRGGGSVSLAEMKSSPLFFKFSCVTCKKEHREYWVEQELGEENIRLQKCGELPRLKLVRNKTLQRFLKEDADNYEKATICLHHGYGVGAFAYFRRVVEKNIDRLLDLVQQDAQSSGDQPTLDAIAELRRNPLMRERIEIANSVLPSHLKPDGLNPLGRLYQVLSEGVHSLSEAECLAKATDTLECLTFLVSELASREKHRARFKSTVGSL